jgi:trk system potassium uptake protein
MRVMIIGGGELGATLASYLCRDNKIICIAKDRVLLAPVEKLPNVTMYEGPGANSIVLERAGIRDCDAIVSLMPNDEANIIACSKAKGCGVKKTAALVNNEDNIHSGKLLGIGYIITPERIEVDKVIDIIESPGINDIHFFADHELKMVGYPVKAGDPVSLVEHNGIMPDGCKILGVVRNYQDFLPAARVQSLQPGDMVYAFGKTEIMDGFSVFSRKELMNHDIVIAGSKDSSTSLELARYFSSTQMKSVKVKVLLNDLGIVNHVKDSYPGITMAYGELTGQNLLKKTHIDQADVFIGGTGSDELNLFTATLAKKLGAKKTLAIVSKYDYPLLTRDLDIDRIVTPTYKTVAEIIKYLFHNLLTGYSILQGGQWEIIEISVAALSNACGKRLASLAMPPETDMTIYRDGFIVYPGKDEIILPNDRVVILSPVYTTPDLFKLFAKG